MPAFDRTIAVDLDWKRRPGVPMEWEPRTARGARWPIPRQRRDETVFQHGRPQEFPRVYGTVQPPKGLSGVLRRVAYNYPDHLIRHWMTLILADRVDVMETRARRTLPVAGALALATWGIGRWLRAKR